MEGSLKELFEPVVEALGCRLWGIEHMSQGRGATLKVYIDGEGRNVDVEDCARVSRQLSSLLDVEDVVPGKYILEVSSPGLDRRLFTRDQFVECAGENIRISLRKPYEGQTKFKGLLAGLEGDEVILQTGEEKQILFPLEQIDKANVVPNI
ncbi:MAG TPA: ribosome maturation factor RimP [Gammaproteobacteria bacterium]|nr:ribosome maturation factor RimP [Gammaproteobacteria bacterium]